MATWQEQLRLAGFPTNVVVIDFETHYSTHYCMGRSKYAVSISEYVADERFEMLGVGIRQLGVWDAGTMYFHKPDVKAVLSELQTKYGRNLERCTVVAKNCKFDILILLVKYGISPAFTVDVEDLSRTYDARMSHKLKDLAPMFKLGYKGDTSQFKWQHFEDIDKEAMETYCKGDVDLETELFKKLLPVVIDPKSELAAAMHTLRLFTHPTAHFDFDLARSLRADMQEYIDRAIEDSTQDVFRLMGLCEEDCRLAQLHGIARDMVIDELRGSISFCELLSAALPDGEHIPTKPGKPSKNMIPMTGEGLIPALAKDDDGTRLLVNHKDDTVRSLIKARQAVKSWPLHIGRIKSLENQAKVSCGLVRVPLKYYGCHTGRWSGEEKVNLGNLGGAGRGKEINELIGKVRHTIKAPPGCVFIHSDSAQIEVRKLAWFAGQADLLQEFRDGGDPYSTLATALFQFKVWKWDDDVDTEEYPGQKKKVTIYRGFGKDTILGRGYGMGDAKAYERCYANDELRPMFDSGEYDLAFIQKLGRGYKEKYSMIPKFWSAVEQAWRVATKYKEKRVVNDKVTFWHDHGTTFMQLPSGRIMRYRNARVNAKNELVWRHGRLWGGSLTENIVQAASRDPLKDWILEIERRGYHVIHHVYDETITVASEKDAKKVAAIVSEVMSTPPAWCPDMPYKSEIKTAYHYIKA